MKNAFNNYGIAGYLRNEFGYYTDIQYYMLKFRVDIPLSAEGAFKRCPTKVSFYEGLADKLGFECIFGNLEDRIEDDIQFLYMRAYCASEHIDELAKVMETVGYRLKSTYGYPSDSTFSLSFIDKKVMTLKACKMPDVQHHDSYGTPIDIGDVIAKFKGDAVQLERVNQIAKKLVNGNLPERMVVVWTSIPGKKTALDRLLLCQPLEEEDSSDEDAE